MDNSDSSTPAIVWPAIQFTDEKAEAHLQQFYSISYWNSIKECLAMVPLTTTVRINTLRYTAEQVVERLKTKLIESCQNRMHIKIIEDNVYQHPTLPDMVCINPPPSTPYLPADKEVIVDLKCGYAVLRGAPIYAVSYYTKLSSDLREISYRVLLRDPNIYSCLYLGRCDRNLHKS